MIWLNDTKVWYIVQGDKFENWEINLIFHLVPWYNNMTDDDDADDDDDYYVIQFQSCYCFYDVIEEASSYGLIDNKSTNKIIKWIRNKSIKEY